MDRVYREEMAKHGDYGVIPLYMEGGVYNFYINTKEVFPGTDEIEEDWQEEEEEEEEVKQEVKKQKMTCSMRKVPVKKFVSALEDDGEQRGREAAEEEVEARAANPGWSPDNPTEAERREHEASGHAVYRSWCEPCIKASGLAQQHRRRDHGEDRIPVIVMDYWYLGEEEGSKPHFVAKDRKSGMVMATAIDRKNMIEGKLLSRFIELLGYREIILKSDGERTIVAMKKRVARDVKHLVKAVCEESPAGDSQANGEAEQAVREVKRQTKAVAIMLGEKLEGGLPEGHPIATWICRYAAEQGNRFKVGKDGRTPEERRTGKKWIKPMPIFGEKIMVKPVGKGRRGDLSRMVEGRYLGTHNRFGSILAMTKDGVLVGTGYHALPEERKWGRLEEDLRGTPWDIKAFAINKEFIEGKEKKEDGGGQSAGVQFVLPAVGSREPHPGDERKDEGGPVPEVLVGGPSAVRKRSEMKPKAKPVRKEMVNKYGATPGCDGCIYLQREGMGYQQVMHSETCRSRIYGKIEEERQKTEEIVKRHREEQEKVEEEHEAKRQGIEETEPASPAREVHLPADVPSRADESMSSERAPEGSPKRKPGEGSVVDIDDLARQAEQEDPTVGEKLQAVGEFLGSMEWAELLEDISAMDVIEVFSPERVNKEVKRFGLRPGASVDLGELKPDGSERWDLNKASDFQLVKKMVREEQPWLVTSSPPCTTFSPLRFLSNAKRDKRKVEAEEIEGMRLLERAIEICEDQHAQGGYFLHEHPKGASSWKCEKVQRLMGQPGIYCVTSPMCKWEMTQEDGAGVGFIRKETKWLTNSAFIAKTLEGVCRNELADGEWHRHIQLIGGRAKAAQVYPIKLVHAILRGLKQELRETHNLSAVEEEITGPAPDDYNEWAQEVETFIDDTSGAELDPKLVAEARKLELDWVKQEKVYERVPRSVNKGDLVSPKIRSRLVAKEVRRAKPEHEQLGASETFSATPPIETVFALLSTMISRRNDGKRKLASWDISRAHFMGQAQREIYVELPPEDLHHEGDTEPMVGRLLRSMYGTQDASQIFQKDYTSHLEPLGAEFCKLCPAIFRVKEKGLIGLVHGDDFLVDGELEGLKWFDKVLNDKYKARWEATLGDGEKDAKQMFFLNRLIRYVPDGTDPLGRRLEIEADARHADILTKTFNFNKGTKGIDIPEDKMTEKDLVDLEREPSL